MLAHALMSICLAGGVGLDPLVHIETVTSGLRGPARMAVAADDSFLVADPLNNYLARFDATGALLGTWSVPEGPVGVAIHPDGRYFVTRRDDALVAIYDATFALIGFLGEGVVTFVRPTDIDIASDTGRIYLVDSGADRVYGFESDGTLALMMGGRGTLPGQFKYPSAIAVDEARGRIVVADHDNFRVQTFTTSGVFETKFGYRIQFLPGGVDEAWMPRTLGLAVDNAGRIYVGDAMMSTVRVFDPVGVELGKVVTYGYAAGGLRVACDLALNVNESRVYVVNGNASSVEVYAAPVFGPAPEGASAPALGRNESAYDVARRGRVRLERRASSRPPRLKPWATKPGAAGDDPQMEASDFDGPHMIDEPVICGRCHGLTGQPGGHVGLVEGQTALCTSCHNTAGQALGLVVNENDLADPFGTHSTAIDGQGRSHAWGVAAVNASADSVGPSPGGEMASYLDGGMIKCATCHNQHNNTAGAPYLRVGNIGDAMCKECHAPRNEGLGELGTHPVGFGYPEGVAEFPLESALSPLIIKGGNVECMTCHAPHGADSGGANNGAGDGMLLRSANDESLCKTCHTEHIGHTPAGSWQPTCNACHDVHDPDNVNLSLVATSVLNQTTGQAGAVVFLSRQGPNSFDDGDPAVADGICQVCHTATTYHLSDGSGASHNDGATCTSCHPHSAGFMPTGGDCTACHSSPQDNGDGVPPGGRRAVVGEFPELNAHAHYGAELSNDACLTCHSLGTHQDGYVELIDPDDGSIYRFIRPENLTSDPDVSTFCAGCHDADGAARLPDPLDPFGNGNVPPAVADSFSGTLQWQEMYGDFCFGNEGKLRAVNSHHDISDADQAFSGAKLECLNCHGAHTAAASQALADPFDTTAPWAGGSNDFCLQCHGGGTGPLDPGFPPGVVGPIVDVNDPLWASLGIDWTTVLGGACLTADCSSLRGIDSCDYTEGPWYVDYSWTHSAHGLDSKRGWNGYSGAPGAELDCQVCHDPHGSYTAVNPEGNPYMIRDFVDGTAFVDDGTRVGGFNGPPWNTFGAARDVTVAVSGTTVDWGGGGSLCSTCHVDWVAASGVSHSSCNACQICHGHGMAFGESDFVGSDDDTPCVVPPAPLYQPDSGDEALFEQFRPLHLSEPERVAPVDVRAGRNAGRIRR